jgi:oligopeptidase B
MAPRRPVVTVLHGEKRVDDWAWLRDSSNPEVIKHLQAENAYCDAQMAHLAPLRERLFEEIRSRIQETDVSAPARKGPWWYYQRTEAGKSYPIHCRIPARGGDREGSGVPIPPAEPPPGAPWPEEEVILDENLLAEGHDYLDVGSMAMSPDHRLLAYGVDTRGDERFEVHVRDLMTGEELPESIPGCSYGLAWSSGSDVLFYTRPDEANRPHQAWRHALMTDPAKDTLVYEEADERFHLGVANSKDGTFVFVESRSKVTSEVRFLSSSEPWSDPVVAEPRRQGVEYTLEHRSGQFFVLTNDAAPNFRLVCCPTSSPGRENWVELVAEHDEVRLEGIEVLDSALARFERIDGCPRIRINELPPGEDVRHPFDQGYLVPVREQPSACYGGANLEMSSPWIRFEYSSLVTPYETADLDLATEAVALRKRQVVRGYDRDTYVTERLFAVADDSTRIPISLVRRRDTPLDGSAPCLLYGYGAYEISIDPVFSSIRLCLLERGFIFAIAHVRGGGELGRRWYEDGKLLAKPHTFSDFVSSARHLIDSGYTAPERLVARGGSAGGLLMGAVANMAPELFRAIVAEVPFVDCLNTMLDPSLPLTVIEWEEWGNPADDPDVYSVMRSYSPYENVRTVRYPDMLVTAGLNDPRVGYFEPAKWVQRLRAAHPDNRVLFHVDMGAGHGGPSGRYDAWREEARVLAFVLDAVGLSGSDSQAYPDPR